MLANPEQFYLVFISIVFGVFFAVWIVPLSKYYHGQPKTDIKTTLNILWTLNMFRGAVTFVMLVCLWWWYGTFIGHIAPAVGYWVYLYDFVTLCSFAVAFQMWNHQSVFPMMVFLAAGLMLGRFSFAYQNIEAGSNAQSAMWGAIVILAAFMLTAIASIIGAYNENRKAKKNSPASVSISDSLVDIWASVEKSILALLVIGIGITFYAVWITEGPPFETPIEPEVWLNKPLKDRQ